MGTPIKLTSNRGLKMGHFRYTMSPIAGISTAWELWREENYCTSRHYFCFISKHGHICRSFLSLTAAFKLNTLHFIIIFIEFEYIL